MFRPTWLMFAMHLGVLLFLLQPSILAQQEPTTADQVIAKYAEAVGADRFSSISTFIERGDLYGNVTNFWQGSFAPTQSQKKERGQYELYFKSPNRRFSSSVTEDNRVIALHGCNGSVAWYINAYLERKEFQPKRGNEYDCEQGFEPIRFHWHDAKLKPRLAKKREVAGRMAWQVKVNDPKSRGTETYDFDAETYLLLRFEKYGSTVSYLDYRDVGGFKVPFRTTYEFTNSTLVSTVRELKINSPIDDSRFIEPEVKGKVIVLNPVGAPKPAEVESVVVPSPKPAVTGNDVSVTEVNFPNFASCTLAELQLVVPELKQLKPAPDQRKLDSLLGDIGAKTLDIARNTPNLISRETVIESQQGRSETRHAYDYLILRRINGNVVGLNEFRVDLNSGEKFRTDEAIERAVQKESSTSDLERAGHELAGPQSGAPSSQGFATAWVHFYPLNRPQATFRYLGDQKMDGRRTLVLAFAEKPPAVVSPALIRYQGKTLPMFLQGIAWVDASDFRILRLRTDLLSPLPEVSLHRFTVDIQFASTRIQQVSSVLSLPRELLVISQVSGSTIRELHTYSEYRLFRAQSRVVLSP
jgi:hypothetical protein